MARKALALGIFSAFALVAATVDAQQWRGLGPEGGAINIVHGVPGGFRRVFAIGNGNLYLSDNAGRTWREAVPAVNAFGPVASDPVTPQRNYVFDAGRALRRSDDLGNTWAATGHVAAEGDMIYSIAAIGTSVLYSSIAGTFRSVDAGATFTPTTGIPTTGPLGVIVTDPLNVGHVFGGAASVALGSTSIYRSTDGGSTWNSVYVAPNGGATLSIVPLPGGVVAASVDDTILVSNDGGVTWSARANMLYARLARTSRDQLDLIATNGTDCRKSSDLFVTTTPCLGGLGGSAATEFSTLTSVQDQPGEPYRVLVSQNLAGGVLALESGAANWSPSRTGLHAEGTRGIAFAPHDSRVMLIGRFVGDRANGALFGTLDGGTTWQRQLVGQAQFVRSIAFDPTTGANPAMTHVYAAGQSIAFPNQRSGGIYKSVDGGANWSPLDAGLPSIPTSTGYRVTMASIRKVLLDARSCANPPASGACTTRPLNTVYAISDGSSGNVGFNVIKSTQGGANWMPTGATLPQPIEGAGWYESLSPVDIEIDPSTGVLYLSTFPLAYNDDDGSTRIPTIESGVFRSSDAGATWTRAAAGLPLYAGSATSTKDVFALAVHPRRAGALWAATIELGENGSRIYRSIDGGATWSAAGPALADCDVRDLQIDTAAPDVIYAAGVASTGQQGCIWRSENGGDDWAALHAGSPGTLPVAHVYDVRQDPQDRRRLVAATSHGVWDAIAPSDKIFTDTE